MVFREGQRVTFKQYSHSLDGVPPVFERGQRLIVIASGKDGVLRAALCAGSGEPRLEFTDTLFEEEVCVAR